MIKVKAKIKLYKGINKRQTPFKSGYRPQFKFIEYTKASTMFKTKNQMTPLFNIAFR